MATKIDTSLNFVVVHKKTGKPRCPVMTEITVRMGDMPIATATRGGKYSKLHAEGEFRRNPGKFNRVTPGWDMAASLGVVK